MGIEVEAGRHCLESQTDQVNELDAQRAAVYGLLARLVRTEVDRKTLIGLAELQPSPEIEEGLLREGYRRIGDFARQAVGQEGALGQGAADLDQAVTDLAVDFVRVFIGFGNDGHSAAYPYESVYTSDKRLLSQGAKGEVAQFMRECGVKVKPSWHEGEDHLACELEFMQELCLRDGSWLEAQREFVSQHLAAWVSQFAQDMRRFAKTGLYLGLADILEGFVVSDLAFLEEAVGMC